MAHMIHGRYVMKPKAKGKPTAKPVVPVPKVPFAASLANRLKK